MDIERHLTDFWKGRKPEWITAHFSIVPVRIQLTARATQESERS